MSSPLREFQYGIYYSKIGKIQKDYLQIQPVQKFDDDDENEKDNNNIILLFAVLGIQVSYPQIFRLLTQNPDYLNSIAENIRDFSIDRFRTFRPMCSKNVIYM